MAKQSLELYRLVSVGFYFSLQFTILNPAFPKSLTQSKSWNCLRGIHKLCIESTNIGTTVGRKLINVVCSLLTSGYFDWNDVYSKPSTAKGIDSVLGTYDITMEMILLRGTPDWLLTENTRCLGPTEGPVAFKTNQ